MSKNRKSPEPMNSAFIGALIWKVNLHNWGYKISFECSYASLSDESERFFIDLKGCSKIRWESIEDQLEEGDVCADVFGVRINGDVHPYSIVITTDLFEMDVTFEDWEVIKGA